MQAEAIAKLQAEITASKNPAVQLIGQFLLQHLEQNPDDASCILNTNKTITKSLEAMRKEAEKKKVGNMAVISDNEGFAIVLNYFKAEEPAAAPAPEAPQPSSDSKKKESPIAAAPELEQEQQADPEDDDIDFDALLL